MNTIIQIQPSPVVWKETEVSRFRKKKKRLIQGTKHCVALLYKMSDLLSSLSTSQSRIHYVRGMSLNFNQGKNIPLLSFLKELQKLCFNNFA